MKGLRKLLSSIVSLLVIVGIGFGSGYYISESKTNNTETVDINQSIIPGLTEKRTVTIEEVRIELVEISEFSTCEGNYTVKKSVDESKYILDLKVPGTKNTITLYCKGVVKVGFDFDDISIKVDNESKKIYIALPDAKVNDNYILWDSVKCSEKNTILNPINFSQYKTLITEIEALGLKKAEEKGIYTKAETKAKTLISKALDKFDGFEIVYM